MIFTNIFQWLDRLRIPAISFLRSWRAEPFRSWAFSRASIIQYFDLILHDCISFSRDREFDISSRSWPISLVYVSYILFNLNSEITISSLIPSKSVDNSTWLVSWAVFEDLLNGLVSKASSSSLVPISIIDGILRLISLVRLPSILRYLLFLSQMIEMSSFLNSFFSPPGEDQIPSSFRDFSTNNFCDIMVSWPCKLKVFVQFLVVRWILYFYTSKLLFVNIEEFIRLWCSTSCNETVEKSKGSFVQAVAIILKRVI